MARAGAYADAPHPELSPGRVLRVYGMRRSGNHAIINWIQRNARDGTSIFLNNCHPKRDPLASFRALEVYVDGQKPAFQKGTPLQQKLNRAGPDPLLVVSYEDTMPPDEGRAFAPLFPKAQVAETVVIIYRSFLNWMASLLHKIQGNDAYGPVARMRIATSACTVYASALDRIDSAAARGFVAICYDRWNASAEYRADILRALSLDDVDNSRGGVQRFGGGSSFQKDAQTAADLKTDRRADIMSEHPEYRLLLWTVAHDLKFMQRLARHFPADARRLLALAETAQLWITLPKEVPQT